MADKKKKKDSKSSANAVMTKEERKAKKQKRRAAQQAAANSTKKRGGLKEYFKGVKTEMKKVVWPTRKELVSYTVVVLFTCTIFGLAIWGLDSGFLAILKAVLQISM